MSKRVEYGWHLMPSNRKLRYGDQRRVFTGRRLSIPKSEQVILCLSGMHAAYSLNHVMWSAIGATTGVLSYVKVGGDLRRGRNKFAGRHRTVLWSRALPKTGRLRGARKADLLAWATKHGWKP